MDINRKILGASWSKNELVNIGYEYAKVRLDMALQCVEYCETVLF